MDSESLGLSSGRYSHVWHSIKNISSDIFPRGKSYIIIAILFYISLVHVELIELNKLNTYSSVNK